MDYLEQFRKQFPSTRVHVEDNYMIYDVEPGFGKDAAKEADAIIQILNLPLEVELNPINDFSRKDTFIVKLKQ
jgi:hypothetical protein